MNRTTTENGVTTEHLFAFVQNRLPAGEADRLRAHLDALGGSFHDLFIGSDLRVQREQVRTLLLALGQQRLQRWQRLNSDRWLFQRVGRFADNAHRMIQLSKGGPQKVARLDQF